MGARRRKPMLLRAERGSSPAVGARTQEGQDPEGVGSEKCMCILAAAVAGFPNEEWESECGGEEALGEVLRRRKRVPVGGRAASRSCSRIWPASELTKIPRTRRLYLDELLTWKRTSGSYARATTCSITTSQTLGPTDDADDHHPSSQLRTWTCDKWLESMWLDLYGDSMMWTPINSFYWLSMARLLCVRSQGTATAGARDSEARGLFFRQYQIPRKTPTSLLSSFNSHHLPSRYCGPNNGCQRDLEHNVCMSSCWGSGLCTQGARHGDDLVNMGMRNHPRPAQTPPPARDSPSANHDVGEGFPFFPLDSCASPLNSWVICIAQKSGVVHGAPPLTLWQECLPPGVNAYHNGVYIKPNYSDLLHGTRAFHVEKNPTRLSPDIGSIFESGQRHSMSSLPRTRIISLFNLNNANQSPRLS
ncbi:hypothetical protein DFH09DRAFT_1287562 [Mycena vulgaris]|nr:hypothetical protein DFH09DRAFT_1287562 [Mycena vulgaris]